MFYVAFLIFSVHTHFHYLFLFIGVTLLAVVSFVDDIKGLTVRQRIPVQALSIFFTLLEIDVPYQWLAIPLLIIAGILIINCYNFIDGINGMLGLYSASVFLFAGYLCHLEKIFTVELATLLFISILVFGFYNFRKRALFFSGDVGSMTMGILAFFVVLLLSITLGAPVIILLLSVCLTDTLGTILKRFFARKNIFEAHREHIYEQLTDRTSLSHLQIAGSYTSIQLLCNFIVLMTYKESIEIQLGIVLVCTLFFSTIYYIVNRKLKVLHR